MPSLIETLTKFGQSLLAGAEIENALPDVLELVIQDTKAERARIELFGQNDKRPFQAAREKGCDLDPNSDHISSKILAFVKETNRPFVSPDAMDDENLARMFGGSTSIVEQNLRSVACVPLRDEDDMFGVLYIDSRSKAKLFHEDIGENLLRLADLMARPLRALLNRALEQERKNREFVKLRRQVRELQDYSEIIGESAEMQELKRMIDVLREFDEEYNIMITGETGTGKELVARMLHRKSKRWDKPFVKYDCNVSSKELLESVLFGHEKGAFTGAIKSSPGHIGQAEGGTLFLDEIGNLSHRVQMKLLHFLHNKTYTPVGLTEERKANVWLIMATNKDLKKLKDEGRLMEDVYYRMDKSRRIHVPPLRERREDIPLFASSILKRYNLRHHTHYRFSNEFIDCLRRHTYPGNFRQLDKYVSDAIFNAHYTGNQTILPEHLPPEFFEDSKSGISLQHLRPVPDNFYAPELPEDFRDQPFITGLQANSRDRRIDTGGQSFPLHDHLLIDIKKAATLPLLQAKEHVMMAFERNFILAARGRHRLQKDVIAELGINKSTYIDKLKLHGLREREKIENGG